MSEAKKKYLEEIVEDAICIKSQLEYHMYDYDMIYAGLCSKNNSAIVLDWVEQNIDELRSFLKPEEFITIENKINELKSKNIVEEEKGFGIR